MNVATLGFSNRDNSEGVGRTIQISRNFAEPRFHARNVFVMALSSHPRNASLKARPWALAYGLSILCARGRFGAYLCSSFPHLSRTTERSVGNLRQRVQSCGLDAETGQWKEIRHFVRRRVAKNGCVSFISGKKKNNAIRLEFFGVSSERNLLEGAVDSPERTAEDEASGETVAVDVTQSTAAESDGDLSDCPPGLREFVFAPPHPFPLTVDPEFLEPEDVREVVRALLGDERTSQAKGSPKIASVWCTGESAHSGSDWRWLQYPEPNALWPNPLLHNHRLQPLSCVIPSERPGHANEEPRAEAERPENVDQLQAHLNSTRLQKLWKYSKVHGISWDELDDMYIQYRERQKERQQRWNDHKQQLLHYAGQVCARRLRAERTEYFKQRGVDLQGADEGARDALLQPRSLFRRMTRR